jgi:phage repressor protein C with HTH and peptisase S24 domain
MKNLKFESFYHRVSEATGIDSQIALADAIGVNRSAITQAKKKDAVPDKWILHLSRKFHLNPDWIESGVGQKHSNISGIHYSDFRKIPKVTARLSAGGGSFEVGEDIEGYYAFQDEWLRKKGSPKNMVLMDIVGNSMEPELRDGDTVLIDESQKNILSGAIYAVGVEDTVMVKRVEKHPSKLVLQSDNKNYSPIYLQAEEMDTARIIGKVIWVCRDFR